MRIRTCILESLACHQLCLPQAVGRVPHVHGMLCVGFPFHCCLTVVQAQLPQPIVQQQLAMLLQRQHERSPRNAAGAPIQPQQQGLLSLPDLRAFARQLAAGSAAAGGKSSASLSDQNELLPMLTRQGITGALQQPQHHLGGAPGRPASALLAHLQAMQQLEALQAQRSQSGEPSALQVLHKHPFDMPECTFLSRRPLDLSGSRNDCPYPQTQGLLRASIVRYIPTPGIAGSAAYHVQPARPSLDCGLSMQAHLAAAAQERAAQPGMPPPTGGAGQDAPPAPDPHLTRRHHHHHHRHHPHQEAADAQQQGQPEASSAWQRARMQDPRAGTSLVNVARMAFSDHATGSTLLVPAAEDSAAGQCSSVFKCEVYPPLHAACRTFGCHTSCAVLFQLQKCILSAASNTAGSAATALLRNTSVVFVPYVCVPHHPMLEQLCVEI